MKLVVVDAPQLSTLGVYLNIGHCNQEEAHDVEGSRHRMKSKRNLYATRYILHIKVADVGDPSQHRHNPMPLVSLNPSKCRAKKCLVHHICMPCFRNPCIFPFCICTLRPNINTLLAVLSATAVPPQVDIIHVYVMISPTSTICGFQLFLALPFSATSMSLGRTISSGVGE